MAHIKLKHHHYRRKRKKMRAWKRYNSLALELKDEVMILSQSDVALYDGNEKTKWTNGKLSLTTHNLYYRVGDSNPEALKLSLETVYMADNEPIAEKGFLFRSDKIIVYLPMCQYIKFSFRKGGMEAFYNAMKEMLAKTHWLHQPTASVANSSTPALATAPQSTDVSLSNHTATRSKGEGGGNPGLRQFGIAGIIEDSKERAKMSETFTDIDDVMNKASVLVENINRLKRNASAGLGPAVDSTAIESIEATLGLGTMVQKKNVADRARFHSSLARELHAWMAHDKNSHLFGRMLLIPLVELFSLYNKARSGDLISPDDLLAACRCMESAVPRCAYVLHTLSSGRMALLHKDDSILLALLVPTLKDRYVGPHEDKIRSTCRKALGDAEGKSSWSGSSKHTIRVTNTFPHKAENLKSITEAKAASLFQVTIPVARDILLHLERVGYLCRADIGFGACEFYWNIFVL